MADVTSAMEFVQVNGHAVEQARLQVFLGKRPALDAVLKEIADRQHQDGSFAPFWDADAHSLDATCYHLAVLEQLGVTEGQIVERARTFLWSRRQEDGSFQEDETYSAIAPPWAKPGVLEATLYLTSNAGFWLATAAHDDERLTASAHFLVDHLGQDGRFPTYFHAHWLAAGFLFGVGEIECANALLAGLEQRLAILEASQLAWMVNALCLHGVSRDHTLVDAAVRRLMNLQQADGRFASEDGTWQDVHTTLEALRALQGIGAWDA